MLFYEGLKRTKSIVNLRMNTYVHPTAIEITGENMAYLDDNHDHLYTAGDPLEELDRELAELKASLDELDGMTVPDQENHPEHAGN